MPNENIEGLATKATLKIEVVHIATKDPAQALFPKNSVIHLESTDEYIVVEEDFLYLLKAEDYTPDSKVTVLSGKRAKDRKQALLILETGERATKALLGSSDSDASAPEVSKELEGVKADLEKALERITELEAIETAHTELQSEAKAIQESLTKVTQRAETAEKELEELRQAQSDLEETRDTLSRRVTELEQDTTDTTAIESLKEELTTAQKLVEEKQREIEKLRTQIESDNTRISKLEADLNAANDLSEGLKQELAKVRETIDSQAQEIEALKDLLSKRDETITSLESELANVRKSVAEKDSEISQLMTELGKYRDAETKAHQEQELVAYQSGIAEILVELAEGPAFPTSPITTKSLVRAKKETFLPLLAQEVEGAFSPNNSKLKFEEITPPWSDIEGMEGTVSKLKSQKTSLYQEYDGTGYLITFFPKPYVLRGVKASETRDRTLSQSNCKGLQIQSEVSDPKEKLLLALVIDSLENEEADGINSEGRIQQLNTVIEALEKVPVDEETVSTLETVPDPPDIMAEENLPVPRDFSSRETLIAYLQDQPPQKPSVISVLTRGLASPTLDLTKKRQLSIIKTYQTILKLNPEHHFVHPDGGRLFLILEDTVIFVDQSKENELYDAVVKNCPVLESQKHHETIIDLLFQIDDAGLEDENPVTLPQTGSIAPSKKSHIFQKLTDIKSWPIVGKTLIQYHELGSAGQDQLDGRDTNLDTIRAWPKAETLTQEELFGQIDRATESAESADPLKQCLAKMQPKQVIRVNGARKILIKISDDEYAIASGVSIPEYISLSDAGFIVQHLTVSTERMLNEKEKSANNTKCKLAKLLTYGKLTATGHLPQRHILAEKLHKKYSQSSTRISMAQARSQIYQSQRIGNKGKANKLRSTIRWTLAGPDFYYHYFIPEKSENTVVLILPDEIIQLQDVSVGDRHAIQSKFEAFEAPGPLVAGAVSKVTKTTFQTPQP